MIFESTVDTLRRVVHLLKSEADMRWQESLEFGNECMFELHQMSRPSRRPSGRIDLVAFERSARAIPHVKAMTAAIRRRDRGAAIESGNAAIAEMGSLRNAIRR